MKLFVDSNFLSPYAMSAYVALKEKGIPFEIVPLNLKAGEQRSLSYIELSTTQRVPTISDGDFNLSESSAISEYLDDAYPGPKLYPTDLKAKAKAREVQAWLRSDLTHIREERSTGVVFLKRSPPPLSEAALAVADKLFSAVERLLPPGRDTLFDEWNIADTDLALMLNRLVLAGDAVPARLASYARQQWQRPSVQSWLKIKRPEI